jgi:hypothetical protein
MRVRFGCRGRAILHRLTARRFGFWEAHISYLLRGEGKRTWDIRYFYIPLHGAAHILFSVFNFVIEPASRLHPLQDFG